MKWFYYVVNTRKDDVVQTFIDTNGNNRGLCVRYTFPEVVFFSVHTLIKDSMNFEIPEFEQEWVPVPQSYVVS